MKSVANVLLGFEELPQRGNSLGVLCYKTLEVNPRSGFTTGTPEKPGFLRSKKCGQMRL
jgi:hypothetical protein